MILYFDSEIQEQKIYIFNPTSKEDMNNVTSLAEDKLVLGGFLFDEALNLARNRKQTKPSSSGWYIRDTGVNVFALFHIYTKQLCSNPVYLSPFSIGNGG